MPVSRKMPRSSTGTGTQQKESRTPWLGFPAHEHAKGVAGLSGLAPATSEASPHKAEARVVSEIAIIGAGYVGVPLADTFGRAGHSVILVDIQPGRVEQLNRGESYVEDVPSERVKELVDAGRLRATLDYDELGEADAILIALPTPLSDQREPDLTIVLDATRGVMQRLKKGQLVVLESTTYPGTTRESLQSILEGGGLKAGEDFHLAFSPERVDPGRE